MPLSNAERQARYRARWGSSRGAKPFIGVDGEGQGTDALGRQNYVLLRAGERELFRDNRRLNTWECLEFLLDCPEHAILVGYFFSYDATMILRDLPTERIAKLFWNKTQREAAGWRSPYVFWEDYAIEFRPRQYFRVARIDKETMRVVPGTARTVNEVGGFFQKSFVEALCDRGFGEDKRLAQIIEGKDRRGTFGPLTSVERAYCRAEVRMLAELMEKLRTDCVEAGIAPASWRGAGTLAARLHQIHKTPLARSRVRPQALDGFAIDAYYGGRFEITTIGRIPGPVYEYDIRSAYPAAMLKLPCPLHTRWHRFVSSPSSKLASSPPSRLALGLFVARCRYKHPPELPLAGFPVRQKGRLLWPREASGVYWSPEIAAAVAAGAEVELGGGYVAETCCECEPYGWVEQLYELRRQMGSATAGYPLKLGLNALYGKLAQREGAAPYRDHLAAGLITAFCRAELIRAYASDPGSVVMLATDALFSRKPLDGLKIGERLGNWEAKIRPEGLFIVQPGIYWSPGSDVALPKTRGIPRSQVIARRELFERSWDAWLQSGGKGAVPTIPVALTSFIGHRMAAHRGKPELAGSWVIGDKQISFDWKNKRQPSGAGYLDGWLASFPYPGSPQLRSQPYDAALLTELGEQLMEDEAAPDFQPWGNSGE